MKLSTLCKMLSCGLLSLLSTVVLGTAIEQKTFSGEKLYEQNCSRCHDRGVLGAPAPGSVSLNERVKLRGQEGLLSSILLGRARMPKRGGCFSCSDDELRQVLEYMVPLEE